MNGPTCGTLSLMNVMMHRILLLLLVLLLLHATYLRAAKVNHIGESEAWFSCS